MDEPKGNEAQLKIEAPKGNQSEAAVSEGKAGTEQAAAEITEDEKLSQQLVDILQNSPSEKEKVLRLNALGYDQDEMVRLFGLKKSTVYAYLPVRPKSKRDKDKEPKEEEEQRESGLPIVLKNGKGEVLSPEAVYRQLVKSDGIDGERDFKALMKWAACIELVQRMTRVKKDDAEALAGMAKPVLDMMEKSREELDAAVARAKESSMAIAEAAAAGAAARAVMHVDQRFNELKQQKADIATVQDPMKGLMARTMETMMNRLQAMLLGGGQQIDLGPGFIDKRQGGK
jgi:hypothetical protein